MKKKFKKYFFYFVGISISFLSYFKVNWTSFGERKVPIVASLYWIQEPEDHIWNFVNSIFSLISIVFVPIIFMVWLYFFLTKKTDENRKKKWIRYMKIALYLLIITFIIFYVLSSIRYVLS